jgi:glucose/arabinose dehydrogenase
MGTRFRTGLLPSILIGSVLFGILSAVTHAVPTGFVNEIVITGLTQPTQVVTVPDGRMFVVEKGGRIVVVPAGGQPLATPLLQIGNIVTDGERGLLSVALSPDFATTGNYYVLYNNSVENHERLARFTASGNTTDPSTEVVLWEDFVGSTGVHEGGSVLIGNDGKLYVSIGDHFSDPTESQSLQSYHGKVLRLNTDGAVPTDNPFFDGAGPNLDAIWALGLRNPFRMSVDAVTGRIYIGDVGGNDWSTAIEEVDLLARGANYGWPICEEFCPAGITAPAYFYRHNSQGASITGGFVYRGSQFPANYVGNYFFGDYVNRTVRGLTLDAAGAVTGSYNFEPTNGSIMGPYGDMVDLHQGVDGALYYVEFGEGATGAGRIHRIRYTAGDQPPVAIVGASPRGGPAPLTVTFSSAGSRDPENMPLTYSWDFGDGTTSDAGEPGAHL